jgi:hypothetical protein
MIRHPALALVALGLCGAPAVALAQQPAPYGAPPYGQPWGTQPNANTAPPQTDPYGRPMQAGGLAPPPPMQDPNAQPGAGEAGGVERGLDQAEEEDSGRGLSWVYIEPEVGYSHVGLATFEVNERDLTAGLVESSADGPLVGAGLGLRLVFVTIGARARVGFYSPWQFMSLGGELGFRIPIGAVEPHFSIGGGYAGLGSLSGTLEGVSDAISIRGPYARAGGGLDIFATNVLSIGANVSWELLVLTRPGVSPDAIAQLQTSGTAADAEAQALAVEGSGYGSAFAATAVIGLHF